MTNGIGAWEINQDLFCKKKLDFAPTLSLHALTALCQKTGGRFSPPRITITLMKKLSVIRAPYLASPAFPNPLARLLKKG